MPYVIKQATEGGLTLRGAALEMWNSHEPEVMLSGPAETGKTIACLHKLHAMLLKYPNASGVMARATYKSIKSTVAVSFEKKVLKGLLGAQITCYGGEKAEWYDYPNGSRLWVTGMDNESRALSGEHDIAYVNQAEELLPEQWEVLLSRVTGRSGNTPYAQLLGDCNPGPPSHWILRRFGTSLLRSKHEDNPTLFDNDGKILPQGVKTLEVLSHLTGVRLQRLRYGRWAGSEGMVYDTFDPAIQIISREAVPSIKRYIEGVDFGFINPFVWQRWGVDYDDNLYLLREIYRTRRTVEEHCRQIMQHMLYEQPAEAHICDHDAEGRATYERHRHVRTRAASKAISEGIQAVQARMVDSPITNKRRIFFVEDALIEKDELLEAEGKPTSTIEELVAYIWNDNKDVPVKANDHGMDPMRYVVQYLDKRRPFRQAYGTYQVKQYG